MLRGLLGFLLLSNGDKNSAGFHAQILDAYFKIVSFAV